MSKFTQTLFSVYCTSVCYAHALPENENAVGINSANQAINHEDEATKESINELEPEATVKMNGQIVLDPEGSQPPERSLVSDLLQADQSEAGKRLHDELSLSTETSTQDTETKADLLRGSSAEAATASKPVRRSQGYPYGAVPIAPPMVQPVVQPVVNPVVTPFGNSVVNPFVSPFVGSGIRPVYGPQIIQAPVFPVYQPYNFPPLILIR